MVPTIFNISSFPNSKMPRWGKVTWWMVTFIYWIRWEEISVKWICDHNSCEGFRPGAYPTKAFRVKIQVFIRADDTFMILLWMFHIFDSCLAFILWPIVNLINQTLTIFFMDESQSWSLNPIWKSPTTNSKIFIHSLLLPFKDTSWSEVMGHRQIPRKFWFV